MYKQIQHKNKTIYCKPNKVSIQTVDSLNDFIVIKLYSYILFPEYEGTLLILSHFNRQDQIYSIALVNK